MSYITQANLAPLIPAQWLAEALDDQGTGDSGQESTIFAQIQSGADDSVNGVLSLQYKTPISNAAEIPFLSQVTALEAARLMYARRGFSKEGFPHFDAWESKWKMLEAIGKGDLQLAPAEGTNEQLAKPRGSIVSQPMRTVSRSGSPCI